MKRVILNAEYTVVEIAEKFSRGIAWAHGATTGALEVEDTVVRTLADMYGPESLEITFTDGQRALDLRSEIGDLLDLQDTTAASFSRLYGKSHAWLTSFISERRLGSISNDMRAALVDYSETYDIDDSIGLRRTLSGMPSGNPRDHSVGNLYDNPFSNVLRTIATDMGKVVRGVVNPALYPRTPLTPVVMNRILDYLEGLDGTEDMVRRLRTAGEETLRRFSKERVAMVNEICKVGFDLTTDEIKSLHKAVCCGES